MVFRPFGPTNSSSAGPSGLLRRSGEGRDTAGRRAAAAAGEPDCLRERRPQAVAALLVFPARAQGRGGDDGRRPREQRALRTIRFFSSRSPVGCSVDDWECIRGTLHLHLRHSFNAGPGFHVPSQGFEIGAHITTNCQDYTASSLAGYDDSRWHSRRRFRHFRRSAPTARIASRGATTTASQPSALPHGIRLDTNYYYWPSTWVNNTPGLFTGSGMPRRFAQVRTGRSSTCTRRRRR